MKIIFQSPKRDRRQRRPSESDGSFVLEQTVHEDGKPARTRNWRMHAVGPNRFTGR